MSTNCKWLVENPVQSFFLSICSLPQYISLALYFQYPLLVQIHNSAYTLSDFWVLYFIPVPRQPHSLGKQDDKISKPRAKTNSLSKVSSNSNTIDGNLLEANYFHLSPISLSFRMPSWCCRPSDNGVSFGGKAYVALNFLLSDTICGQAAQWYLLNYEEK